jgi:hypothetical protein
MRFAMRQGLSLLSLVLTLSLQAAEPAEPTFSPEQCSHWAFQKPHRPDVPRTSDPGWVRTSVDAFLLAQLDRAGLKPSPPADRATLLRRVTFDLTGLPPTPEEVEAFLADRSPKAYEKVVNRLLASPHYGERWAQHWLDVVRYAESNGYEVDGERPHAWRYRDYVVRSLNADKPYNQFVIEQLAGDLLVRERQKTPSAVAHLGDSGLPLSRFLASALLEGTGRPTEAEADLLVAAGFNRCGPVHLVSGNLDAAVQRQEVLTEMTTAVGSAFLGLTVGCARCHDHKFDPLSLADYYRLESFFAGTQPREMGLATSSERADHDRRKRAVEAQIRPLKKQVADIDAPYQKRIAAAKKAKLEPAYRTALETPADKRTPEQKELAAHAQILIKVTWDEIVDALSPADRERRTVLRTRIHELETHLPPPTAAAWTVAETSPAPATHVLKRGSLKNKGAVVHPAFPRILRESAERGARSAEDRTLSRLDLAHWLTRPDHPLTARVIVNRLWQHHFGRGLVGTPNDFGLRGERPTHPELLDWLATELVESGWSLKHLHRLMVLSAAYQQDSRPLNPDGKRLDPDNRLLWRMNRQRLEGEFLRDNVLAVTGALNPRLGGPMVRVPLEPEVYDLIFTEGEPDGLWPVTPDPREHVRRSLYLFAKRNVRLPMLEAFDQPDTLTSCPVRPVSTFAPQALILLNGPFMQEQARVFAARLLREAGTDASAQIDRAYRLALSRPPREAEAETARQFLDEQTQLLRDRLLARLPIGLPANLPEGMDPARAAALTDFCLALLNRNEFVYVR